VIPRILPVAAMAAVALLGACTGVTVDRHATPELATLRAAGYRVAVVPFAVTAPDDGFFADSLAPVGELLALEANRELPMRQRIAELVQGDVVAWLQQTEFEVVDPWHVATQLSHAGITAARASDPAHVRAVAAAIGADGIVYGDLRRWNRGYYVVQSVVEVMLHLELVDATSGRQLFRTDRAETIGSGLTGGPTGYVSAATEPIAGLRGSNLRNLTRAVARHAVADLNGGDLGNQPGPTAPRLALVALAKDKDGPFRAGERVDVIAIGSPDCEVRFDLGRMRTLVPMQQTARDDSGPTPRATYLGHYIVMPEDAAEELPVTCTIERGAARRRVTIRYRWEGSVSLAGGARSTPTAAR
jgi:hypothetical protein